MNTGLSQYELNNRFVEDISRSSNIIDDSEINDYNDKPILIGIPSIQKTKFRVYIFNCTECTGRRNNGEYRIQLKIKGMDRNKRGSLEADLDSKNLLIGYADTIGGIWVIFDAEKHREFAYSANVQVYFRYMLQAMECNVFKYIKNRTNETVLISDRHHLLEAIQDRVDIDFQGMIGDMR